MTVILRTLTEIDHIVCDTYEEAFGEAAKLKGVEHLEIEQVTDYVGDDDDPVASN